MNKGVNTGPILLVEDDPDDEALILRNLGRQNLANEILVARDGEEALDYLFGTGSRAGHGPISPALVLLDIKLPKINGIEVLKRIRDNEPTRLLSVVVLTSSDEDRDIHGAYELHVNSYVQKPVDFTDFSNAIREIGLYWLLINKGAGR